MQRSTLLDDLGSMLDPSRPGPSERVRHDLQQAIDGAGAPRRTAPALGRRRLVTAASLALALTVVTLAVQIVRIAGRPPASVASAADILNQAALTADREPELAARPDQFVFTEWVGLAPTDPPQTRRLQRWQAVDGTRDGLLRWRPAAEPSQWNEETQTASGQPAFHADLPADPDSILRHLYEQRPKICDGNGHCAPYTAANADMFAFAAVDDLLQGYVPPRARAALFRATARIGGTTVVHDVVDAAGRHGIAVRERLEESWIELIFDPDTFRVLGSGVSSYGQADVTTANQRVAIVDRPGQLP